MPSRQLEPLAPLASDGDVEPALQRVATAIDGSGPALAPVPAGRSGAEVLVMAQLDQPLELGPAGEPVALVAATSGSTGQVKGALLPGSALEHAAAASLDRLGGPGQWLLALPVTSIAGLSVLVRSLVAGTSPVLLPAADGFTVRAFVDATERVTATRRYVALVPTQIWRLVAGPPEGLAALASYDAVLVGGAALDDGLATAAMTAGARIVRSYGMTETCGGCVYDGVPLTDVDLRAPVDGPVEVGGPVVFAGYRLRPDLTSAALRYDGSKRWHVTNDLGTIGADGRLHVLGRLDDVIVTGGVNVAAWTIARALTAHPGVGAVEVLGVPDGEWGQRVVAFVVSTDPADPPTLDALRSYARASLPAAALPRQVIHLAAIPRLPTGKPDRPALLLLAAG